MTMVFSHYIVLLQWLSLMLLVGWQEGQL